MILASKMLHAVATYILSLAIKGKKALKKQNSGRAAIPTARVK
jgi:hypothetical protein